MYALKRVAMNDVTVCLARPWKLVANQTTLSDSYVNANYTYSAVSASPCLCFCETLPQCQSVSVIVSPFLSECTVLTSTIWAVQYTDILTQTNFNHYEYQTGLLSLFVGLDLDPNANNN